MVNQQYETKAEVLAAINSKPKEDRTLSEVVYLLQNEVEKLKERIGILERAATEPDELTISLADKEWAISR